MSRGIRMTEEQARALNLKPGGARVRLPQAPSKGEALLEVQLRATGMPMGVAEYRFHPTRRWRFDRAWPDAKVAIEIQGLTGGAGGRHQRRDGYQIDLEKIHAAMAMGWTVIPCTFDQVKSGEALALLKDKLEHADGRRA